MARPAPRSATAAPAGDGPTVLVMGTGLIGGWLGGRLQGAGAAVHFVGRLPMLQAMHDHGLTLTDLDDGHLTLDSDMLYLNEAVPPGLNPDLVLLCVKAGDTALAAAELDAVMPPGTLVLALQNGIGAAAVAQAAAPRLVVLRGMVPFNVTSPGPGRLHRGTDGALAAQTHMGLLPWLPWFEAAGLPLQLHDDMLPVQWGKLLLNLNNAVNAVSGLPLRAQLLDADLRACTAALIGEALQLLQLAGIRPARVGGMHPSWLPMLLRLPTPLFRLAARRLLRVDAMARSSMADDLVRCRPTEIDAFQGEVLRLAAALGQLAPINARLVQLVRSWSPNQPPRSGASLRKQLGV